jgi:type IV pilus assembly protein PilN
VRFNINLASQPYEDAGQFYRKWIPLLLVLAVLTLGLSAKAISVFSDSRKIDRDISEIDRRLAALEKVRADASAVLAQPQNSGTRDAAQFLNEAFRHKIFSWTQVMSDLEQLVPTGVQVVSIKPKFEDDQLQFDMEVGSQNRGRVIELVRRMEGSPRFPRAAIASEKTDDRGLHVIIQATYSPVVRAQ